MITKNFFNHNGDDSFEISRDEIPLFLDLFPFACIIINSKQKTILAANGLVTELTSFGRHELIGLDVRSLIDIFPLEGIDEGKNYHGLIKVKEKLNLPISYEIRYLSKKQDIAIIKIVSEIENEGLIDSAEMKLLNSLTSIHKISLKGNENEFYKSIKTEVSQVFSFSNAYIYLIDEKENLLKNHEPDDGKFPDWLTLVEMERIKKIDYWSLGKRVLTEIHRAGRKHGFSSVISVPLGKPQIGLIVFCSNSREMDDRQQQEIELYFDWINQFLGYLKLTVKSNEEKNRLVNNNYLYTRILELSNDCFVLVDEEYKINTINQNALSLLGYSAFEIIGHNFFDVIQSDKVKNIIQENGERQIDELNPIIIHDRTGSQIPVRMKIMKSDIVGSKENIIVFMDMSEEIKSKAIVERTGNQAVLGEVIADFAHEVRNPINNISTGLQLMRKKLEGDESSLEIVDRLQSDCVRMNDLMESILSFSRQNGLNFKPFDVFELLLKIQGRFSNKFQKFNIKFNLINHAKNTIILGEIRSIDQVFTNLVNNAVDAMTEKGGELTIKIDGNTETNASVAVTISDTGRGIPEDLREKIFEPFISGKVTGTGLGLAITKRIIEAHNGKIKVDSYTNGTIFTVILKLANEE